jgi:hypothetical protein
MGRGAIALALVVLTAGCGSGSATTSQPETTDVPAAPSTAPASSEPAAASPATLRAAVVALAAAQHGAIDPARCSMEPGIGGGAPSLVCKGDGTEFNQLKLKALPSKEKLRSTYERDLEQARKSAGARVAAGSGDCSDGFRDAEGEWSDGSVDGRIACWQDAAFGQTRLEWTAQSADGGYVLGRASLDSSNARPLQTWWQHVRAALVVAGAS